MGNQQNTIVLNGKLYDAVTGRLIHQPPQSHHPKPKVHKRTGLVMDGVVHSAKTHGAAAKPKAHRTSNHSPAHSAHREHAPQRAHTSTPAVRHKPQRPATLMRQTVAKPAHRPLHKSNKPAHHALNDRAARRLDRAQAVPKSRHIQRFPSHQAHRSVTKKHAPVHVEPAPIHLKEHHAKHLQGKAPTHSPTQSPAPLSASEKLVTTALKNARAHEANTPFAKKPKKRLAHALGVKRRSANLAMGGLAALLLVGFFTYQNIPNLSMRLASTRAGFSAQLPGYQPAGFSQDRIVTYSPGKVSVNFQSNSDDRAFQLTQQVSNWNSQALADNHLAANNKQYQVLESGGKTIYIYDATSATWVNGGIWYQIEGESSLTSEQLLKIANSI